MPASSSPGVDTLTSAVPVIPTANVPASLRYFEDVLGFTPQWSWGDPPVYAGVRAGQALLYLCHDPEARDAKSVRGEVFIWTSDIESLHRRHSERRAEIVDELRERPWGARQYAVREPNGYVLKFAEEIPEACGPEAPER